jgi:hypothetical protein
VQDVLSFVNGNHSLKLGADVHHVHSTFIDLSDLSGTYNFASAGDFLAGVPSRFRQNFQSSSTQKNLYTGVFVQDEWQILPQLLLSYGCVTSTRRFFAIGITLAHGFHSPTVRSNQASLCCDSAAAFSSIVHCSARSTTSHSANNNSSSIRICFAIH